MSVVQPTPPAVQPDTDQIEIRLGDVVQFLKDSRWTVLRFAGAFLLIGLLYAFSKTDEFTATVRVMPELKGASGAGGLSDLRSLAGLAGVSLDNATAPEAIRPDLYPDIVESIPFALHLLSQPVAATNQSSPVPLQKYLTNQAQQGLLARLLGDEKADQSAQKPEPADGKTLRLTPEQEALTKQLKNRVSAVIDKKTGIMTLSALMPDPNVAATVARQTLDYLTNYVTAYRTGKARQQVQFLDQQVTNARRRYQAAEYALSSYRDRNRNLFLNTAKIDEQRLQADFLLAQTVYNDLSKQLEQARIKVQEEAPVFQVLEPPRVPLRKSGPNRLAISVGFAIFGAIVGLATFFVRRFFNRSLH